MCKPPNICLLKSCRGHHLMVGGNRRIAAFVAVIANILAVIIIVKKNISDKFGCSRHIQLFGCSIQLTNSI